MKRTGARDDISLIPVSRVRRWKVLKMALVNVGARADVFILPFSASIGRFEFTRSISKMASSCKAGRNKRRQVKVG